MSRLVALVAGLAFCASSAMALGPDVVTQRRALVHNRALWAHQHLRDYRFRLRVTCFCQMNGKPIAVTVRHGRPTVPPPFTGLGTFPEMFALIRGVVIDPESGGASVRYDTHRGFPRSAALDPIRNAIDDEIGWTVDRFRVLPAA